MPSMDVIVRGPNNKDLSVVIAKVVFQLHASFAQPIQEFSQPPFEVTERGWGKFEAQIRIIWKDSTENRLRGKSNGLRVRGGVVVPGTLHAGISLLSQSIVSIISFLFVRN
jgi:hypothetical protein